MPLKSVWSLISLSFSGLLLRGLGWGFFGKVLFLCCGGFFNRMSKILPNFGKQKSCATDTCFKEI